MAFWTELLPELQQVIRTKSLDKRQDRTTCVMLAFTCKTEYAIAQEQGALNVKPLLLFNDACLAGHLSLVQWFVEHIIHDKNIEFDLYCALAHKHWDVGEWLHGRGVKICGPGAALLARQNNREALQWLVDHGDVLASMTCHLLHAAWTNLDMVRWLVEEQHVIPDNSHIRLLVPLLPESRDVIVYYLGRGLTLSPFTCMEAMLTGNKDIIDLFQYMHVAEREFLGQLAGNNQHPPPQ